MYEAGRRPGWRGRAGFMRGIVRDADSGAIVLLARSPAAALVLSELLNRSLPDRPLTTDRAPIPRYAAFEVRPGSGKVVISADALAGGRGLVADGLVATTYDHELARHVVELLNRANPALRNRFWLGWF